MPQFIEIDSVLKTFGSYQLLTDIYLRINPQDVIGLFGRNGTGKTVFMKILFGTMKADHKFIRLDGEAVITTPFRHPGLISYLPQHSIFPRYQKIDKLVRCFLNQDAVLKFYADDGIAQSNRMKRVNELSSGERRYLEAKMLLLSDTRFVLLDEPFDFLSPVLVEKLSELITIASASKGVVITDHNYRQVLKIANRILLLKEGTLKELTGKEGLVEQGYVAHL